MKEWGISTPSTKFSRFLTGNRNTYVSLNAPRRWEAGTQLESRPRGMGQSLWCRQRSSYNPYQYDFNPLSRLRTGYALVLGVVARRKGRTRAGTKLTKSLWYIDVLRKSVIGKELSSDKYSRNYRWLGISKGSKINKRLTEWIYASTLFKCGY